MVGATGLPRLCQRLGYFGASGTRDENLPRSSRSTAALELRSHPVTPIKKPPKGGFY